MLFNCCCLILNKVRANPGLHLLCFESQSTPVSKYNPANINEDITRKPRSGGYLEVVFLLTLAEGFSVECPK